MNSCRGNTLLLHVYVVCPNRTHFSRSSSSSSPSVRIAFAEGWVHIGIHCIFPITSHSGDGTWHNNNPTAGLFLSSLRRWSLLWPSTHLNLILRENRSVDSLHIPQRPSVPKKYNSLDLAQKSIKLQRFDNIITHHTSKDQQRSCRVSSLGMFN